MACGGWVKKLLNRIFALIFALIILVWMVYQFTSGPLVQGTDPSLASSYPGASEGENVSGGEGAPGEGIPVIYVVAGVVAIVVAVSLVFALKKRRQ